MYIIMLSLVVQRTYNNLVLVLILRVKNNHNMVDTYVHQGNITLKKVRIYKVCKHYIYILKHSIQYQEWSDQDENSFTESRSWFYDILKNKIDR